MNTILFTVGYSLYLIALGIGARIALVKIMKIKWHNRRLSSLLAHGLFTGLVIHVLLLNLIQLLGNHRSLALIIMALIWIFCLCLIVYAIKQEKGLHNSVDLNPLQVITIAGILLASVLLIWNSYHVPNLAWDTWTVWVAKAQQWYYHGLGAEFSQSQQWLQSENALLNASAHYPDGLSLIFYPLLFTDASLKTALLGLYLVIYGFLVLLMCNRLQTMGAPFYLRFFLVMVMYSTPLLVNHILLPGYADLIMAAYILLIFLGLLDYNDQARPALGVIIMTYALMLPLIKLEGWVWLLVILFAHSYIMWFNYKQRIIIATLIVALFVFWLLIGGFAIETAFGPFVVTPEEINLFNKAYLEFGFTNVTNALLNGLLWQFNWSLLWFALPFLLFYMVYKSHNKAQQVSHLFFILAFTLITALFYLTPAAKYALDYTALNRIFLQLTPCYILLLFTMLTTIIQSKEPPQQSQ